MTALSKPSLNTVSQTLGLTTPSLKDACTSSKVNMWSVSKPKNSYGLKVMNSGSYNTYWAWDQPTTPSLLSFDGYDHSIGSPYTLSSVTVNGSTATSMTLSTGTTYTINVTCSANTTSGVYTPTTATGSAYGNMILKLTHGTTTRYYSPSGGGSNNFYFTTTISSSSATTMNVDITVCHGTTTPASAISYTGSLIPLLAPKPFKRVAITFKAPDVTLTPFSGISHTNTTALSLTTTDMSNVTVTTSPNSAYNKTWKVKKVTAISLAGNVTLSAAEAKKCGTNITATILPSVNYTTSTFVILGPDKYGSNGANVSNTFANNGVYTDDSYVLRNSYNSGNAQTLYTYSSNTVSKGYYTTAISSSEYYVLYTGTWSPSYVLNLSSTISGKTYTTTVMPQ